jgi:hypothetical protein
MMIDRGYIVFVVVSTPTISLVFRVVYEDAESRGHRGHFGKEGALLQ